ncbi:uncharacterized protein LOC142573128 [Dermacentor variabilis]|uniref:uncharacterized protein LOC142573128 n=1 Tax=Dermacentor variabilis TaxID=34621 RepID=UPI003F5B2BEC
MLRSGSLLVLVAGLALCLDLDNVQRSSHFPGSAGPSSHQGQQHHYAASKRTSVPRRDPEELHGRPLVASASSSPEERLYYRLLSSRMARLLPALLGEQQQQYPGEAPLVGASSFFDDGSDDERDDSRHDASNGGVADEDAREEEQGDEQEADQVMMYLPKRRVVHSTAGSMRRRLQQPMFAEMDPSGPVYGIRRRVPPFKRRLHVQVARRDEKRSTRRQQKDAASPFRRKTLKKAFGKKQTAASSLKEHSPSATPAFRLGHQGSGKSSAGPTAMGNATLHKGDAKADSKTIPSGASSGGSKKQYHIMKRSSFSTDDKITGELRNIFGDDEDDQKKRDKKTLKKRENTVGALKGSSGVDDASEVVPVGSEGAASPSKGGTGTATDEDKFKKWLLDEYYRTMALSFASMRRKRMATHQDTLDLRQVKRTTLPPSAPGTADDQFQAVEDKLRTIEDAMIGEAVALVRDGAGDEAELRAINAGVASRLDAAYDLESVRQSLEHLQSTLEDLRRQELQAVLAEDGAEEEEGNSAASNGAAASGVLQNDGADVEELTQGSSWAQLTDKQNCPAVQVLSSSCPAAAQSATPVPAMQRLLLDACQWQHTCYVCGSYYGLGAEDCDGGGGNRGGSSQFTRQLVSQLLLRQAKGGQTQAACAESCLADFLLSH